MVGVVVLVIVLLAVVVLFVVSIFLRRHRETDRPQPGWKQTPEVFNDPSTNRVMRVWLDQRGERHYVAEGERPAI